MHYAHIKPNPAGAEEVQSVALHCQNTAQYAADCLSCCNLKETAFLAGYLHDMGKCTQVFSDYLWKAYRGEHVVRGSVNHTFAAVRFLLTQYHGETPARYDDIACELIAYAAGAHHGLFDCVDEQGKHGFSHRLTKEGIDYEQATEHYFQEVAPLAELNRRFAQSVAELEPIFLNIQKSCDNSQSLLFHLGCLARLLSSAVMEGDRRDTREFVQGALDATPTATAQLWHSCLLHLEELLREFPSSSPIHQARAALSNQCRQAANKPEGIWRLDLPTGAGKTLASLRFAFVYFYDSKISRSPHGERGLKFHILPKLTV